MKIRKKRGAKDIDSDLTPMIDVVFQLLIFFLLTLKIVAEEGDFSIRMPASGVPQMDNTDLEETTTLKVRMTANLDGELIDLSLDNRKLAAAPGRTVFDSLRQRVLEHVGDPNSPSSLAPLTEVEFDCDYKLNYKYVIEGITAVSGEMRDGVPVKLIEKIKFAPPRKQG